ncbi:MAG: arsenate reductase (glutaredoxin) [Flavobacteriaceae bacterium]|jgi:arsenate reductase|nr:arsenate reductase (glutaredoxin) [Flavobacteriaceae bacterium]MCB0485235.1 arsenate reductase (glutaredoxin) [Flavobacteriaceae bacterium]
MKIYHNPRCRKSREGLEILQKSGQPFEIVEYLNTPPTESELKDIISKLGVAPIELIRKNETEWKENYKGKELSDDEMIKAMVRYPKLIERPIVIKGTKAVVGRPPENIKKLL